MRNVGEGVLTDAGSLLAVSWIMGYVRKNRHTRMFLADR